jgi:hypothetical protein
VCGLKREDIDLDHAELHVVRQVQRRGGKVIESEPKSTASNRTVALDLFVGVSLGRTHPYAEAASLSGQ